MSSIAYCEFRLPFDIFQYSITPTPPLLMNFTILSRNSTVGTVYTDRPAYQPSPLPQSWKKPSKEHPHLNPSKSKVNVRTSLNKSGESFSLSNPNLDNVRASCFVGNPPKPSHLSRQSLFDDKYARSGKENHDMSFEINTRESLIKLNSLGHTSFLDCEDRKKCDSTFLRSSAKEPLIPRFDDESGSKDSKTLEDIKAQLVSLTKKVFVNEEEIARLKQKKQSKKLQTLESQFTQFQIQMFDICKKNTNYFSEFEDKIEKNNRQITEIRERLLFNTDKDHEREEVNKRLQQCEAKISDIQDKLRNNEDLNFKSTTTHINMEQSIMKNYINEHMSEVKLRLDKQAIESNEILVKIHQLERELLEKRFQEQSYKRDNRICGNPIIIERREVLVVKEPDSFRDLTSKYANNQATPTKDTTPDSKREALVRQNIYYIDSHGYLLDENKYYLLNSKNQHILIPEHLLACLKENNMLVVPSTQYKK